MAGNTFGQHLKLTTYGASHGAALGGILDGLPAGISLDLEAVQRAVDRRRPGQSKITTQRKEGDQVQILSGIFEGKTLGTPIAFQVGNTDAKSKDYDHLRGVYRPSHADRTYQLKYGHRDHRGGGRASARETVCRVVAGALAAQLMPFLEVNAYVSAVGEEEIPPDAVLDLASREDNPVRCPHAATAQRFEKLIRAARKEGDTLGGIVSCRVTGLQAGWGEPVFAKLDGELARAMLSINATKGFEVGSGFAASRMRGSQHNDGIRPGQKTATNNAGGIEGGITNGEDLFFRVAFKPVATLLRDQQSVNQADEPVTVQGKGRHDPCVVPRAVPIVEAMTYLTLADHFLRSHTDRIAQINRSQNIDS